MLCIIASHRIDKEHVGTGLWDACSTEMIQHCPLHVLEEAYTYSHTSLPRSGAAPSRCHLFSNDNPLEDRENVMY